MYPLPVLCGESRTLFDWHAEEAVLMQPGGSAVQQWSNASAVVFGRS